MKHAVGGLAALAVGLIAASVFVRRRRRRRWRARGDADSLSAFTVTVARLNGVKILDQVEMSAIDQMDVLINEMLNIFF